MERVFLVIDGSNFYHRLQEIGLKGLLRFHYGRFAEWLSGKKIIAMRRYYIGFSHKPSYGLITHSDVRRLLRREDLEQFLV